MLNLTEQEIRQLAILSAQLNSLLGGAAGSFPGVTAADGCNGGCEGGCAGCKGCSGCDGTSQFAKLQPMTVDDLVRVFDNLDTLGTVVLSPEVLNQALLRKKGTG